MSRRRAILLAGALATIGLSGWASAKFGHGRRFWYPYAVTVFGARTHEQVVDQLRARRMDGLRSLVRDAGLAFPPDRLRLIGLKEEKTLEIWGRDSGGNHWSRIATFPVLAASGGPGPKLREGDRQVPEGLYELTAFNPNSSYHLSIRVDYPNADDRVAALGDGRKDLGSDIFIHGKSVSIGCLAIGDDAIEQLYLLLAETGLRKSDIVIAPNASPTISPGTPIWLPGVYEKVRARLRETRGGGGS